MAVNIKDKSQDNEKEIAIEPIILNSVKIRYVDKTIEVPKFVSVDIDKPIFIEKEYEKPVIVEKEYERPVLLDRKYERPFVIDVKYEKPVIIEKEYERPVLINKNYERPVFTDKKFDIPIINKIPYDLPVVSMEKVDTIASKAVDTLNRAQLMLDEIGSTITVFKNVTNEINITMKDIKSKLDAVKNYEIIEEKYIVKVPELIKEKITVIGKIISRENM